MFVMVVLFVSVIVGVVVTLGASFAVWYYTRRFGQNERRAAIVIGVSFALLFPAMYCAENLLPGRPGEIVATVLMITICVVGVWVVRRILAARGRNV